MIPKDQSAMSIMLFVAHIRYIFDLIIQLYHMSCREFWNENGKYCLCELTMNIQSLISDGSSWQQHV